MKKFKILLMMFTTTLCLNNFAFAMEKLPQNNNLNNQQNYDDLINSSDNFKNFKEKEKKPDEAKSMKIENINDINWNLKENNNRKNKFNKIDKIPEKNSEEPKAMQIENINDINWNLKENDNRKNKFNKINKISEKNPEEAKSMKIENTSDINWNFEENDNRKNKFNKINKIPEDELIKKVKDLDVFINSEKGVIENINRLCKKIQNFENQKNNLNFTLDLMCELFNFVDNKYYIDNIFSEIKDIIENKNEYKKQVEEYYNLKNNFIKILEDSLNLCKELVFNKLKINKNYEIDYNNMVNMMERIIYDLNDRFNTIKDKDVVNYTVEIVRNIIYIAKEVYIPKIQEKIDQKYENTETYVKQKNEIERCCKTFEDILKNRPIIVDNFKNDIGYKVNQIAQKTTCLNLNNKLDNVKKTLESKIPTILKINSIQEFIIDLLDFLLIVETQNKNEQLMFPKNISNLINNFNRLRHKSFGEKDKIMGEEISSMDDYLPIFDNATRNEKFVNGLNKFFEINENNHMKTDRQINAKDYQKMIHPFLLPLYVFKNLEKQTCEILEKVLDPIISHINLPLRISNNKAEIEKYEKQLKNDMLVFENENDIKIATILKNKMFADNQKLLLLKKDLLTLNKELKSPKLNSIFKNKSEEELKNIYSDHVKKLNVLKDVFEKNREIIEKAIQKYSIVPQYLLNYDF